MFAPLADARVRGRGGSISPGQEEGGTFNSQEALADAGVRRRGGGGGGRGGGGGGGLGGHMN